MKEIVVISGKGGTGKTSITAAFAYLAGKSAVIADCDVDASNLHLVLQPKKPVKHPFFCGEMAILDQELCIQCGKCLDVCQFDAVLHNSDKYTIDDISCEGCGYCSEVCPSKAITMETQQVGTYSISNSKVSAAMVDASLFAGAENSGKLVAKVKNQAKEKAKELSCDIILVDGSPGIGCPVVSSLSGANYVVIVTEPTISGFHDLKRVISLIQQFHLPSGCIINKYDLNPSASKEIKDYLQQENILYLGDIPYHSVFSDAIKQGKTILEMQNQEITDIITPIWEKLINTDITEKQIK